MTNKTQYTLALIDNKNHTYRVIKDHLTNKQYNYIVKYLKGDK